MQKHVTMFVYNLYTEKHVKNMFVVQEKHVKKICLLYRKTCEKKYEQIELYL